MKRPKIKVKHIIGILLLGLPLMNCSKKSNSSTATTAAGYVTCPSTGYYTNSLGQNVSCTPGTTVYTGATSTTTGYTTCPSTGYYTNNGVTYTCTPGTSVYIGGTTTTGYTTCPTTGYYVSNGMTYACTPGTSVYTGGTTTTTATGTNCSQPTAYYGVQYVPVYYNGQYVCMRYDLAYGYGYYY